MFPFFWFLEVINWLHYFPLLFPPPKLSCVFTCFLSNSFPQLLLHMCVCVCVWSIIQMQCAQYLWHYLYVCFKADDFVLDDQLVWSWGRLFAQLSAPLVVCSPLSTWGPTSSSPTPSTSAQLWVRVSFMFWQHLLLVLRNCGGSDQLGSQAHLPAPCVLGRWHKASVALISRESSCSMVTSGWWLVPWWHLGRRLLYQSWV